MNRKQLLQGALAASIAPHAAAMQHLVTPNASWDVLDPSVASVASVPSHLDLAAAVREYLETRGALRDVAPPFVVVLDHARCRCSWRAA